MFDVYAFCDDFRSCVGSIVPPKGLKDEYARTVLGQEGGLVGTLISDIIPIVLGIAGFIAVIMIVISGIQFITSGGNPEAAGAARNRLTYALIGFVVIILSFAILQIVNALFLNSGVV